MLPDGTRQVTYNGKPSRLGQSAGASVLGSYEAGMAGAFDPYCTLNALELPSG